MDGDHYIEWRIREDVEAASHNWHVLNTFFKLEDMQKAFDQLNHAGQLEFRHSTIYTPEKTETKKSFFKNEEDEKSNRTSGAADNNSRSKSVSEPSKGTGDQLPLL